LESSEVVFFCNDCLLLLFAPPFHQFLMALSDLPFKWREISAHFFPYFITNDSINSPSSTVMGARLRLGFKFWWYLSLHCLGVLVAREEEMRTQFVAPKMLINSNNFLSSAGDHGPLLVWVGADAIVFIGCDEWGWARILESENTGCEYGALW
jgi:hypothetical protein